MATKKIKKEQPKYFEGGIMASDQEQADAQARADAYVSSGYSNNVVKDSFTEGNVSPADEVIGAGPNAGLTQAEVDARDAAYLEETGNNYYDDFSTPDQQIARSNRYYSSTTKAQALADTKKREQQKLQKEQSSQLTTYSYNPETIAGTKKASDNFMLALNKINNEPFSSSGTKTDNLNTQLSVTANELGKNWASSADFLKDFTSNPDIQKNLDAYIKAGGTKEQIVSAIDKNVVDTTGGADQMQSTADYLANLTPEEAKLRQKAVNDLIPEMNIAQDEIARNYSIADDIKSLYFGTPESLGIYDKMKIQAEEDKRIAEEKEKDEENSLRDMAEYQMQKNEADVKIAKATIEKNRLSAKNYMTGMLAKLGALNTTSSAVVAITNLDEKYQEQASKLDSDLSYANRGIELKLNDAINTLERDTDTKINNIEKDLTKDEESIAKEIMKAQQEADKKSYDIQTKYASLIRTKTAEYTKQAKTQAEKYAKDYAKIASTGIDMANLGQLGLGKESMETAQYRIGDYVTSGKTKGIVGSDGKIVAFNLTPTQIQQVQSGKISGEDAIRYFINLPTAFKNKWIEDRSDDPTRYNLSKIQEAYEAYKKESEKKTSGRER